MRLLALALCTAARPGKRRRVEVGAVGAVYYGLGLMISGLSMRQVCLLSIVLCLSLSACGGGGSGHAEPAVNRLLYDETTDGALPRGLSQLSPAEISRITFALPEGTSVVRGTSSVGESFLIQLDSSKYVQAVSVRFVNQSANNDHLLQIIPYPYLGVGGQFFGTPMATVGVHEFTVPMQNQSIGAGLFEVYTGTSVSGPPQENSYSLTFVVARR
jgi:hypothetical protein